MDPDGTLPMETPQPSARPMALDSDNASDPKHDEDKNMSVGRQSQNAESLRENFRQALDSIFSDLEPLIKIGSNKHVKLRPLRFKYFLSYKQMVDMKKAFKLFDVDFQGLIQMKDLRVAIRALGYEPTGKELKYYMSLINRDGNDRISFEDFLYLMALKMFEKDNTEDLKKSFALLGDGSSITFRTLKRVVESLGEEVDDEILHEMIQVTDTNNNNKIEEHEYINFMKKHRFDVDMVSKKRF